MRLSHNLPTLFTDERQWYGKEVINLSGYEPWEIEARRIRSWIDFLSPVVTKLVLFPDISPTEHRVTVPTGVVAEFDVNKTPNWLQYVKGADIGCGVAYGFWSSINKEDFLRNQEALDELYELLILNKSNVRLGGGNHFLDFVVDIQDHNKVGVVVHTGSYGDAQKELSELVGKSSDYWKLYPDVINSGIFNRLGILDIVQKVYGSLPSVSDTIHNTVEIAGSKGYVYKGVTKIQDTDQELILPSSLGDLITLYRPGAAVGDVNLWGTAHGTGRAVARSNVTESMMIKQYGGRVFNGKLVESNIHVLTPTGVGFPLTELPSVYHSSHRAFDVMSGNGLLRDPDPEQRFLEVIGYIGHMEKGIKRYSNRQDF